MHLNPVRADLVSEDKALESYRWSSYGEYLKRPSQRVKWLRVDRLMGECGIAEDSPAGRRRLALCLEQHPGEPPGGLASGGARPGGDIGGASCHLSFGQLKLNRYGCQRRQRHHDVG